MTRFPSVPAHVAGFLLAACTFASPANPGGGELALEDLAGPHRIEDRWGSADLDRGETEGRRWVRATTRGDGTPALVTSAGALDPPRDLRGRFVKTWVRVDRPERLAALELRLSSDGFASSHFTFRVPLFADVSFGVLQPGLWIPLTLSFGTAVRQGEPHRERINAWAWYVEDRGEGPVSVSFGGISAREAPEAGVLSFTFDDGYDEHARVAAPVLARHGLRGTAYVMPDQVGLPGYASLAELEALRDRFGWDVAAHHAVPFTEFAPDELRSVMRGIRGYLERHGFATGAGHLALPLGKHDPKVVLPLVREHFETTRLAASGPETLPPADPHRLRALNVTSTTPPEEIARWARRARDHGEWAILMFHYLVETPQQETDYAVEAFARAVELVKQSGVRVRTVSEVWDELRAQ